MSHWESSGKSDDWYTPKYIFDALGCQFDVDVAAPMDGIGTHVPAGEFLCKQSLQQRWHGFIWMNPPFGGRNGLDPWLAKFFGNANGIALVPDRTSAPWFLQYAPSADLLLFLPKVRFLRPDGTEGKSPSTGTCLMAVGDDGVAALLRAAWMGFLARPEFKPTDGAEPSSTKVRTP